MQTHSACATPPDTSILFKIEQETFSADKLQCMACGYFRSMFRSGFSETINHTVVLQETDPQIFRLFLKFLKKQSQLDEASYNELIALKGLASFYDYPRLDKKCDKKLMGLINNENVLQILELSESNFTPCLNYINSLQSYFELIGLKNGKIDVIIKNDIDLSSLEIIEAEILKNRIKVIDITGLTIGKIKTISPQLSSRFLSEHLKNLISSKGCFKLISKRDPRDINLFKLGYYRSHLEQVFFSYSEITDKHLLLVLKNCSKLNQLFFHKCDNMTDNGLHAFVKLHPKLKKLKLENNANLHSTIFSQIAPLCQDLEYMLMGKPTPSSLDQAFSDNDLIEISRHCHQLRYLTFPCWRNITCVGLKALSQNCPRISSFKIAEDIDLLLLSLLPESFPNIKFLHIANTKLSKETLFHLLKNLKKLKIMVLNGYCTKFDLKVLPESFPYVKIIVSNLF